MSNVSLAEKVVKVEIIHREAGQRVEIVLQYTDLITLADTIIIAKETLRHVARKYNYYVTFLPQPFFTA